MKIKKFNIFITSDINSFGKTLSITNIFIYFCIFFFSISLLFSFLGFYYFFFSRGETSTNFYHNTSSHLQVIDSLLFFQDPVKSKINSDFETSFITSNFNENHLGVDINGNIGTKIYSPMPGKVIYEGYDKKMGNIIIISHDNGYISKYMHNKENFVKIGQKISLDNPIGAMGNSGSLVKSEGLHVHFELWNNGIAINPIPFIKNLKLVDTNTLVSK